MSLPAQMDLSTIVIDADTREEEQYLWDFSPMRIRRATLPFGDYRLAAAPELCVIERKAEGDFISCCGAERERFEKCVRGMLGYENPFLIIESSWARLMAGEWRSRLTASQVCGSLIGWACDGLNVILADDHQRAGRIARSIFACIARRRYRELRGLLQEAKEGEQPGLAAALAVTED